MATAVEADSTVTTSEAVHDVISMCAVCMERYTDPRVLHCGHHFCLGCLTKVAEGHPQGAVTCPSCRHVTKEDVNKLPKYKITEFETKVTDFLASTSSPSGSLLGKQCDLCTTGAMATLSCYVCRCLFCRECEPKHKFIGKITEHRTTPISPFQFCTQHPQRFVQVICKECGEGCCALCCHDHENHTVFSLQEAAKRAKDNLVQEVIQQVITCREDIILDRIRQTLSFFKDTQQQFTDAISTIRREIESFQRKLETIEKVTEENIQAEIKNLELIEFDLDQFIQTKCDLRDYVTKLTTEVSEAEIVFREKEFPKYASSSYLQFAEIAPIDVVDISKLLAVIPGFLKNEVKQMKSWVQYTRSYVHHDKRKDGRLEVKFKADTDEKFGGLLFDEQNIIMRTLPIDSPIRVFDNGGATVRNISLRNATIESTKLQDISYDNKRHVYVLPSEEGFLVVMDRDGNVKYTEKIVDAPLHGICCSDQDMYIISSASGDFGGTEKVYVFDAKERNIVVEFPAELELSAPLSVHCGYDTEIGGDAPLIYVSNHTGNNVQVLSMTGQLLHTYTDISLPRGMCTGTQGEVLVCSCGDRKIYSLKGREITKLNTVAFKDEEYPRYVACDPVCGELYVGCTTGALYGFCTK